MQWKRGLHRIYFLLCLIWLGYWLVVVPWQTVRDARKGCQAGYRLDIEDRWNAAGGDAERLKARTETAEANLKECYALSSPISVYGDTFAELLTPWVFGSLVLIPLVAYALAWGLILPARWVVRGFLADSSKL